MAWSQVVQASTVVVVVETIDPVACAIIASSEVAAEGLTDWTTRRRRCRLKLGGRTRARSQEDVADGITLGGPPSLEGAIQSDSMSDRGPMITSIPSNANAKK